MPVECPACKSTELYEIERVCFEDGESYNGINNFSLFAFYGPSGEMGWMGEKNKRVSLPASARVCGACGHASLFADLEQLKELVAGGHIRKLRQP